MSEEKKSDRILEELKKKFEELLDGASSEEGEIRKLLDDINKKEQEEYRRSEEDMKNGLEHLFDWWFVEARVKLTEDEKIFLENPTRGADEDLIIFLGHLWIVNFKISALIGLPWIGGSVCVPSWQALFQERIKFRNNLRKQGEEYKKFWIVKKNYDGIVKKFKDHMNKETVKRYAEDLFYKERDEKRRRNGESSLAREEGKKQEEIDAVVEYIRLTLDEFVYYLETVRKGVKEDLRKEFGQWAKEQWHPLLNSFVIVGTLAIALVTFFRDCSSGNG